MLTRDDVLRMAEESGFGRLLPARGSLPACWHGQDIGRLEKFAAAAYAAGQAAEREACAVLVDGLQGCGLYADAQARRCAAAIRARGEKGGK